MYKFRFISNFNCIKTRESHFLEVTDHSWPQCQFGYFSLHRKLLCLEDTIYSNDIFFVWFFCLNSCNNAQRQHDLLSIKCVGGWVARGQEESLLLLLLNQRLLD